MSTSQGNDPASREIIFQEELIDRLNKLLAHSPEVAADISKVFSARFLCSRQTAYHPEILTRAVYGSHTQQGQHPETVSALGILNGLCAHPFLVALTSDHDRYRDIIIKFGRQESLAL
jgi:hypothetical protein